MLLLVVILLSRKESVAFLRMEEGEERYSQPEKLFTAKKAKE